MADEFWARPIFRVRDVEASLAYYGEKLGFSTSWTHGGEKLVVAEVERGGFGLVLDWDSVLPRPASPSVVLFALHKSDGLGDLYREFASRGADILSEPFPVIWQEGVYQFNVKDLDGNMLIFAGDKPA